MSHAISVRGLSKRYRIRRNPNGRYGTDLADDLVMMAGSILRGRIPRAEYDDFWALHGVDFDVPQGEALGLVGRNGAGKSTLLKLLARVVRPTGGEAILRGRIGSLLEVGTGFHPDLTGRENIFLAGAFLGLKRAEIRSRFDEIVDFSEVSKFLDTPVKRYSSGMYTRLAFAVSAHLEADILLVDEVLAVGDAAFQRKCLGKMGDVTRQGRTVVFVSHSMQAVKSLCTRCLWLQGGKVHLDGSVREVADAYFGANLQTCTNTRWDDPREAPGDRDFRLASASISEVTFGTDSGEVFSDDGTFPGSEPLELRFEFWNLHEGNPLTLHAVFLGDDGETLFRTVAPPSVLAGGGPMQDGRWISRCMIPASILNAGIYRIRLEVARGRQDVFLKLDDLLRFEIRENRDSATWCGRWPGAVLPQWEWITERAAQ